ncbi:oligosaccharide flippase family protein [Nitrospira defluvii]|nr:oligosaccharide flippase family protein [Nitrospira defluvii]
MQKRQILINVVMSVVQVIVVGGTLFVLYRFLINTVGVERLGVWSVVLATTSVANIANLGLSASVVKFVAKYLAHGDEKAVVGVIQTSVISIGVLIGLILLIAYPFAGWLLGMVLPIVNLEEALSILPYALLSLWITVISSILHSGLDGYQRIDHRSILLMAGAIIHLLLCFMLVPDYGLMGLAYARILQVGLILIGSWLMLKRHLHLLPAFPYRWNYKLFKEIVGYGLNFQVISICNMLYDPITKALLTKFGGLTMTGLYEMASRMVLQVRSLIVSSNQVLVPTFAELKETTPTLIHKVYKDSYRLILYVALPMFSVLIAVIPIISHLWIGYYEAIFVLFSSLLAFGWFINTLTAPAYFANLGTGDLRWNTTGHVTIAVLNIGLGWSLGNLYGGTLIVVSWVVSLIIGSLIVPVSYYYRHGLSLIELIPMESFGIGLASIGGLFTCFLSYHFLNNKMALLPVTSIIVFLFLTIIAFPLWVHPMRKRLTIVLNNAFQGSE